MAVITEGRKSLGGSLLFSHEERRCSKITLALCHSTTGENRENSHFQTSCHGPPRTVIHKHRAANGVHRTMPRPSAGGDIHAAAQNRGVQTVFGNLTELSKQGWEFSEATMTGNCSERQTGPLNRAPEILTGARGSLPVNGLQCTYEIL